MSAPRSSPVSLPQAWAWFTDQAITQLVKSRYSPQAGWKDKPFSEQDARFFLKGIRELSSVFTEDRPEGMGAYLRQPKFRSSYLLYFLPLQAAKFSTLYSQHQGALLPAIEAVSRTGEPFRVLDLGAGPGTGSLAFLLWLLERTEGNEFPRIDFEWVDTDARILEDGRALLEKFQERFPRLAGRVRVRSSVTPWWTVAARVQPGVHWVLLGNVLNESRPRDPAGALRSILAKQPATGAVGVLCVEPADRRSSQLLSQVRDDLVSELGIVGPCLHLGNCPLARGRDWCHFSSPIELPGRWFRTFSLGLGSVREWVKYSYLWLSPVREERSPTSWRVVSDPIRPTRASRLDGGAAPFVLLCEPDRPARHRLRPGEKLLRGDLVRRPAGPLSGASGKSRQASLGRLKRRGE